MLTQTGKSGRRATMFGMEWKQHEQHISTKEVVDTLNTENHKLFNKNQNKKEKLEYLGLADLGTALQRTRLAHSSSAAK